MESHLLLVWTSGFLVFEVLCAEWLHYACNPDTYDYSVINPDPEMYHHARVTDGIGVECATSFSEDYKVFNITNCVKDGPLRIILSHEVQQSLIIGGKQTKTFYANCDTRQRSPQAIISFETEVTYLPKSSGFSAEFLESDPQVEVILRDLRGVEGYSVFTIGYPMWVELKGPAGTEILPTVCLAYSGQVSEGESRKTVIENGCSLDESLILDFSENVTNWFDLEFEGFNPDLMFSEGEETGEEEEKAEESQPQLQALMYAFRFFDTRTMVVKCIVRLCPNGSGKCDLSC